MVEAPGSLAACKEDALRHSWLGPAGSWADLKVEVRDRRPDAGAARNARRGGASPTGSRLQIAYENRRRGGGHAAGAVARAPQAEPGHAMTRIPVTQ